MTERYFTVTHNNRSYAVIGNENTSLDTVWNSQKCWFMKDSEVTIEDDKKRSERSSLWDLYSG